MDIFDDVEYVLNAIDMCQLRESKGMTTIKFRPHSGEVIVVKN